MKKNLVIAALAIALIDTAGRVILTKKALVKMGDLTHYLATMLDENGVQISEFDKIAMSSFAD